MNPYLVLNLTPDASDAEIRSTYLRLAKRYPPTRAPRQFSRIAEAYGLIDTPEKRLEIETFGGPAEDERESLEQQILEHLRTHRPRPSWSGLCGHFGEIKEGIVESHAPDAS